MHNPPLPPQWKRYLAAFDRHLLGDTLVERSVARVEMLDTLRDAGMSSREHEHVRKALPHPALAA